MYVHYKFLLSHRTSIVGKKIISCVSWSHSPPRSLISLALPLLFAAGCASTCLGKSQSWILRLKETPVCL